jgi:hypothetical protein
VGNLDRCPPETLVPTHQTTQRYNTEEHSMNLPYHENVTTIYFRKQIKWTNNLHQWDQKGRPQSTCGSLCLQPPDRGHIHSEPSGPSTWHHYICSCAKTTNNGFTQPNHLFDQRVICTTEEWQERESEIYFHEFILDISSFQFEEWMWQHNWFRQSSPKILPIEATRA